jgi:hypothetical protein
MSPVILRDLAGDRPNTGTRSAADHCSLTATSKRPDSRPAASANQSAFTWANSAAMVDIVMPRMTNVSVVVSAVVPLCRNRQCRPHQQGRRQ